MIQQYNKYQLLQKRLRLNLNLFLYVGIIFFKIFVGGVTILEPNDKDMLSQIIQSDNIYNRIISVMKQSTQEYYNMRMLLGLKCA